MELSAKKKEILLLVTTRMEFEGIPLNEISQTEDQCFGSYVECNWEMETGCTNCMDNAFLLLCYQFYGSDRRHHYMSFSYTSDRGKILVF